MSIFLDVLPRIQKPANLDQSNGKDQSIEAAEHVEDANESKEEERTDQQESE